MPTAIAVSRHCPSTLFGRRIWIAEATLPAPTTADASRHLDLAGLTALDEAAGTGDILTFWCVRRRRKWLQPSATLHLDPDQASVLVLVLAQAALSPDAGAGASLD